MGVNTVGGVKNLYESFNRIRFLGPCMVNNNNRCKSLPLSNGNSSVVQIEINMHITYSNFYWKAFFSINYYSLIINPLHTTAFHLILYFMIFYSALHKAHCSFKSHIVVFFLPDSEY